MNIICDKTLLSAAIDGVSKAVTLRSTIPVPLAAGALDRDRCGGQVLDGDDRVVGAERQLDPGFLHHRRPGDGEVLHLRLAAVAQDRTGNDLGIFLRQDVGNQMSLCAVDNDIVQVELSGNADGGADIVCPVTVEMGFHIPFQQGQQCLRLCIIVRHMLVRVLPDWLLVYRIEDDVLVLTLARTGTHSDLFGK